MQSEKTSSNPTERFNTTCNLCVLASTNPVFRCTVLVPRQIRSFGGMSFQIAHALFYVYEIMRLRADVDYHIYIIISHPMADRGKNEAFVQYKN